MRDPSYINFSLHLGNSFTSHQHLTYRRILLFGYSLYRTIVSLYPDYQYIQCFWYTQIQFYHGFECSIKDLNKHNILRYQNFVIDNTAVCFHIGTFISSCKQNMEDTEDNFFAKILRFHLNHRQRRIFHLYKVQGKL